MAYRDALPETSGNSLNPFSPGFGFDGNGAYGVSGDFNSGAAADLQEEFIALMNQPGLNSEQQARLSASFTAILEASSASQRMEAIQNFITVAGDINAFTERSKLNYSNSYEGKFASLVSIGFSPTAARQMLGEQSFQSPTVTPTHSSAPDPLSNILGGINTGISAVSSFANTAQSIFNLVSSAKRLNFDLSMADSAAQMSKLNLGTSQRVLSGIDAASSFIDTVDYAKSGNIDLPDNASDMGVNDWLDLFRSNDSDPVIKDFLDNFLSSLNTYHGRKFANELLNSNIDNDYFGAQRSASLHLQNLEGSKLVSEIANVDQDTKNKEADFNNLLQTNLLLIQQTSNEQKRGQLLVEQTELTHQQSREAKISALIAQGNYDIYTATYDDLKATAVNNALRGLELSAAASSPEALQKQVETLLNDVETSKVLSVLCKQNATARLDYWNSNPEQFKIISYVGDPYFKNALENIVTQANIEATTVTQGIGPVRVSNQVSTAAFMLGLLDSDYQRHLINGVINDSASGRHSTPFWANPDGTPAQTPW